MANDLDPRRTGAGLSGGLEELVARLEHLDDDEVLAVLVGLQRAQARLAWVEAQALTRLAGPHQRTHEVLVHDRRIDAERVVQVTDEVRDEVASALRRSPSVVHDQITTARLLNGPLAATSRALRDGLVTSAHVRVIAEQARRHPAATHCANAHPRADTPMQAAQRAEFDRVCEELQARVLSAACRLTVSQTRVHARRAMAAVDADGERRRREAARCTRDVWVSPDDDGMSTLVARLDAVSAHAIRAAIDAAAADPAISGDCTATLGERRAEALAALVLGQAQVSVQVEVTMPSDALGIGSVGIGWVDSSTNSALPDGTMVDSADVVRLLDRSDVTAHLRRLVTDPATGIAVDLGRRRYEVSGPLRRWIAARDRTCRFPGCRRRAAACQVDHIDPWDDGGSTDAANLHALCTRHHQLKTHAGWRVEREPARGRTIWTSPLGRTYVVDPEPVPVHAAGPPPSDDPLPF
jgi:hypothetical protein